MTLANIISSNRRLDLSDVTIDTNDNDYDLTIDFYDNNTSRNTSTTSIASISIGKLSSSLSAFERRNMITVVIMIIIIVALIVLVVVGSVCGFSFNQC